MTEHEQPTPEQPDDRPAVAHDTEQYDIEVEPNPEPDTEPADPHQAPLDDDDDAKHLDPVDPRRRDVEQQRGQAFDDDADE